jgi:predicted anti-sigma-YlaC factor YlaD
MPEFREHISCQELVELTSDYIESALSAEDAELLEQHLNYCAGCERYVDEMLRTIRAEARLREEGVPEETIAPIIEAFRERRPS